jgi:hypothetical protein
MSMRLFRECLRCGRPRCKDCPCETASSSILDDILPADKTSSVGSGSSYGSESPGPSAEPRSPLFGGPGAKSAAFTEPHGNKATSTTEPEICGSAGAHFPTILVDPALPEDLIAWNLDSTFDDVVVNQAGHGDFQFGRDPELLLRFAPGPPKCGSYESLHGHGPLEAVIGDFEPQEPTPSDGRLVLPNIQPYSYPFDFQASIDDLPGSPVEPTSQLVQPATLPLSPTSIRSQHKDLSFLRPNNSPLRVNTARSSRRHRPPIKRTTARQRGTRIPQPVHDHISGRPASRRLACPFWKMDPVRHRACLKSDITTASYVKQHLARKHHGKPYCPRCLNIFKNDSARDTHLRGQPGTICEIRPLSAFESSTVPEGLISDDQKKTLEQYSTRGAKEEEQWFVIWDVVFPGRPRPPSAYVEGDISEDLASYQEFSLSKGLAFLLEGLNKKGIAVSKEQLEATFREITDNTFKAWVAQSQVSQES